MKPVYTMKYMKAIRKQIIPKYWAVTIARCFIFMFITNLVSLKSNACQPDTITINTTLYYNESINISNQLFFDQLYQQLNGSPILSLSETGLLEGITSGTVKKTITLKDISECGLVYKLTITSNKEKENPTNKEPVNDTIYLDVDQYFKQSDYLLADYTAYNNGIVEGWENGYMVAIAEGEANIPKNPFNAVKQGSLRVVVKKRKLTDCNLSAKPLEVFLSKEDSLDLYKYEHLRYLIGHYVERATYTIRKNGFYYPKLEPVSTLFKGNWVDTCAPAFAIRVHACPNTERGYKLFEMFEGEIVDFSNYKETFLMNDHYTDYSSLKLWDNDYLEAIKADTLFLYDNFHKTPCNSYHDLEVRIQSEPAKIEACGAENINATTETIQLEKTDSIDLNEYPQLKHYINNYQEDSFKEITQNGYLKCIADTVVLHGLSEIGKHCNAQKYVFISCMPPVPEIETEYSLCYGEKAEFSTNYENTYWGDKDETNIIKAVGKYYSPPMQTPGEYTYWLRGFDGGCFSTVKQFKLTVLPLEDVSIKDIEPFYTLDEISDTIAVSDSSLLWYGKTDEIPFGQILSEGNYVPINTLKGRNIFYVTSRNGCVNKIIPVPIIAVEAGETIIKGNIAPQLNEVLIELIDAATQKSVDKTYTDYLGAFSLIGPDDTDYYIKASKTEYAPTFWGNKTTIQDAKQLHVPAGVYIEDIDLILLPLSVEVKGKNKLNYTVNENSIYFSNLTDNFTYSLYTLSSVCMQKGKLSPFSPHIDLTNLNSGIYFIELSSNTVNKLIRFVK